MIKPCPRCGRIDRIVCEVDEQRMTESIRCTRCPRASVTVKLPIGHSAQDAPAGLETWNGRLQQGSLFEDC